MNTKCIVKRTLLSIVILTAVALAQDVKYNYDRDTNFVSYKSYQWADSRRHARDPLIDQDIRRAIDSQLAQKGLQKADSNADLQVEYLTAIDREKQLDGWTRGPRWNSMGHATTSTMEVGTLLVNIYDSSRKQLVWRGTVSKTLNISKDPDKNYKNLEKAVAKLLKDYPPKEKSN